ncbi:hypothetical protein GCM10022252_20920 [Streptosporangium oxazolinicum]|uniref:CHAT domain-containing protein n=1 Tax=Streptosporangium oxazolinicum TaxID=909287 RepID=A0ABP8AQ29_9ACTN
MDDNRPDLPVGTDDIRPAPPAVADGAGPGPSIDTEETDGAGSDARVDTDGDGPDPLVDAVLRWVVGLVRDVHQRVVSEEQAVVRAREGARSLTVEAADALAGLAGHNFNAGRADSAYLIARLLMEAADARWETVRPGPRWRAADLFVEMTRFSLVFEPDRRRFQHACAVADAQIDVLRREGDLEELAETMFAAGILRVDPYIGIMGHDTPGDAYKQWRAVEEQRLSMGPGAQYMDISDEPAGDDERMPHPRDAALDALTYLQGAAALSTGHPRARCLKGLVDALMLLGWADPESPGWVNGLMGRYATEAVELLDAARDPHAHVNLLRVLHGLGVAEPPASLERILPVAFPDLVRTRGAQEAVNIAFHALRLLRDAGRHRLRRELASVVHEHLGDLDDRQIRRELWNAEVHTLTGDRLPCPAEPAPLADSADLLRGRADAEDWPEDVLAVGLAHLAAHTPHGEELLALELLDKARESRPEAFAAHRPALGHFEAELALRCADGRQLAGELPAAVGFYARAAVAYTEVDLTGAVVECLEQIASCAARGDEETVAASAVWLCAALSRAGSSLDESVSWAGYVACQQVAERLVERPPVSPDVLLTLYQTAKGLDFAVTAARTDVYRPWPGVDGLLARIGAAESGLGERAVAEDDPIDDIRMLCYTGRGESRQGSDELELLENLKRALDRETTRWLLNRPGVRAVRDRHHERVVRLDDLRRHLPDRTVLVSMFLGQLTVGDPPRETAGLHLVAMTRDDLEIRVLTPPTGELPILMRLSRDGYDHVAHPLVFQTAEIREAVLEDPLHRPVGRRGADLLAEGAAQLLGNLPDRLDAWRREGRDHLCLWPHGPLHYLPFHLLHHRGRPLADDWTVTTLTSLEPLSRPPSPRTRDGGGLVSVGSSHGGVPYGLAAEPGLESHAAGVAALARGTVVTGAEATPERVLAEAARARYLHIAAHGSHDEVAPWFQCLYLAPGETGEGRLFAHDVLRADLRGVEVVTLGSCESALGRFDINDNLRGLPAGLLLAGARAVVGCLWPVHPGPATLFFGSLHAELQAGAEPLDAFRRAQRSTRDLFPAYRDWGAFCFVGDWRRE